jgi:hypothetical protein
VGHDHGPRVRWPPVCAECEPRAGLGFDLGSQRHAVSAFRSLHRQDVAVHDELDAVEIRDVRVEPSLGDDRDRRARLGDELVAHRGTARS